MDGYTQGKKKKKKTIVKQYLHAFKTYFQCKILVCYLTICYILQMLGLYSEEYISQYRFLGGMHSKSTVCEAEEERSEGTKERKEK